MQPSRLLGGVLLVACASAPARAAVVHDSLEALRPVLEESSDEALLRRRLGGIAGQVGFELADAPGADGRTSFVLKLAEPVPAQRLCDAMGWKLAYAVPDVSEKGAWSLRVATAGTAADRPIDATTPHVGMWTVDATLAGAPGGDASKLVSGAYKLGPGDATLVAEIRIARWSPDWKLYDGTGPRTGSDPPKSMKSTSTFKEWLEQNKVYGGPQYVEVPLPGARVFAAWNIPTSGINTTDFWIYCRGDASDWTLLKTGYFQPPEDQAHSAEVDPARLELLFLGANGAVYHREPVAKCLSGRSSR